MRSLVAISPSAQMKPPSLTILTLFSAPLTGLRSGAMNASAISLIEMLEFLPSTLRSTAARSTAPGSAKVEFPAAEFGEPLNLHPQPGSQLQNSRYVPEIVQLAISVRGAELGDPEAARCGVELVELDDRAAFVTPGVVPRGNDEGVARVRGDLSSVVHSDLHRSLDHVADVRVAAAVRTHLLRELPAGRIVRALDLDVAQVDDVDLDAALLHLLVRLIECPTRGLAHGCHCSLPSSLSLRATLLHPRGGSKPCPRTRSRGEAGAEGACSQSPRAAQEGNV